MFYLQLETGLWTGWPKHESRGKNYVVTEVMAVLNPDLLLPEMSSYRQPFPILASYLCTCIDMTFFSSERSTKFCQLQNDVISQRLVA